jgi:hypothetical protein
MFTAQVVLIIAAVAFVALAIAGSAQFVQIKFPELKPWSRWLLGIAGAGLFAAAFLIPSVANQSPGQAPSGCTADSPNWWYCRPAVQGFRGQRDSQRPW